MISSGDIKINFLIKPFNQNETFSIVLGDQTVTEPPSSYYNLHMERGQFYSHDTHGMHHHTHDSHDTYDQMKN